jgi:hypothetical protein
MALLLKELRCGVSRDCQPMVSVVVLRVSTADIMSRCVSCTVGNDSFIK